MDDTTHEHHQLTKRRDRQDPVAFRLATPATVGGYTVIEAAFFTPGGPGCHASALAVTRRGTNYSTHVLLYDESQDAWSLEVGHYDFATLPLAQEDLAARANITLGGAVPPIEVKEMQDVTHLPSTGTREQIVEWVREHQGKTPAEIAAGLGLGRDQVRQACRRMVRDGQLRSTPGGTYYP
ncbi:hypothetical protein DMC64_18935 [Amycolatopsis sp. WAC 04197]|uniref:hypothetical protein n=1 Tax=Amycolatopsis sp. WAC 04197 TaxID=2203199 RepID=UPI000F77B86E|nr:hypothetical protein [Amycolatopsis sp. WAC 04197]RSN44954.1 hypothetical protein DMC64_18935 [Amycolatopsis sp. WAC 04197]